MTTIKEVTKDDKLLQYDALGMKQQGISEKSIVQDIKDGNVGWKFSVFKDYARKRELANIRDTRPTTIIEGVHKCKKCHNKKISMYSLQTRGGDEPMTNFFTCISCGNRWKG